MAGVHGVYHDGAVIVITTVVFLTLAIITFGVRMWARSVQHAIGVDDICASFCMFFLVGLSTVHIMNSTDWGHIGANIVDYTPEQIEHFMLGIFIDNFFYFCTSATVKLSVLLLYRRIFVSPAFRHAVHVMIAIVATWWVGFMVAQICSCIPIDASWIVAKQATARCINTAQFYDGVTISNLSLDWIILIMPLTQIWRLQMSVARKIQISALFAAGVFTCICSILRTYFLITLDYNNFTVTIWKPAMWTTIEPCVGLICANLPPSANRLQAVYQDVRSLCSSLLSHHHKDSRTSLEKVGPDGETFHNQQVDGRIVRSIGGTTHFIPRKAGDGRKIYPAVNAIHGNRGDDAKSIESRSGSETL